MYVGNCYVHHQVHDGVHKYFLAIDVGELLYKNFGNWRKKIWEKMHFFWELQIFETDILVFMYCIFRLIKPPHTYRSPTRVKIGLVHVRVIGTHDLRIYSSKQFFYHLNVIYRGHSSCCLFCSAYIRYVLLYEPCTSRFVHVYLWTYGHLFPVQSINNFTLFLGQDIF